MSRLLVIDASVARASGGADATHPTAGMCRDFLEAVLKICHRMVLTSEIKREWNQHQSRFARSWRVSMMARRKVVPLDLGENGALRNKVKNRILRVKQQEAALKDFHLIEAALASDLIIASLDSEAGALMKMLARNGLGEIVRVAWVDPSRPEEAAIQWLEGGARRDAHRLLGARPRNDE